MVSYTPATARNPGLTSGGVGHQFQYNRILKI